MSGQGYNFGGKKAALIKERLAELKRDPNVARRLFGLAESKPPEKVKK